MTGGDSGIGRAVAVLFAREGADIGLVYLNEEDDAQATKRLVEREGRRCLTVPGDVGDPQFCKKAVETIAKEFGKLPRPAADVNYPPSARPLNLRNDVRPDGSVHNLIRFMLVICFRSSVHRVIICR